jgi:hypothetical protein
MNETRPGNQTESNQIKNLQKALGLEKALGLDALVERPSLPELSRGNWERGELCNVERGLDRRKIAFLERKQSNLFIGLSPQVRGFRSKDDKNKDEKKDQKKMARPSA